MEEKYNYLIWNDAMGMVAMGQLVKGPEADGSYQVKDPASVIFSITHEELPGQETVPPEQRKTKGMLRFDIQPYLFNAVLKDGDQIWTIKPNAVLKGVEINDELKAAYVRTVAMSSAKA